MLRLYEKALTDLTKGGSRDNKGLRKLIDYNCITVAENEIQSQVIQNSKPKDFNNNHHPSHMNRCQVNAEFKLESQM